MLKFNFIMCVLMRRIKLLDVYSFDRFFTEKCSMHKILLTLMRSKEERTKRYTCVNELFAKFDTHNFMVFTSFVSLDFLYLFLKLSISVGLTMLLVTITIEECK